MRLLSVLLVIIGPVIGTGALLCGLIPFVCAPIVLLLVVLLILLMLVLIGMQPKLKFNENSDLYIVFHLNKNETHTLPCAGYR